MSYSPVTRRLFLSAAAVAALFNYGSIRPAHAGDKMKQKLGLEGYCPVCVIEARKWEKGRPDITSSYDGTTYQFPSQAIRQKFETNPSRYVPALGGDCIVCYAKLGKRVPGNIRKAVLHKNRLFLFPGDKELQAFRQKPNDFINSDLAANGECVVCLAMVNKHVPGSEKFTEIHNGLRYLFPSAKEQAAFRASPAKFAVKSPQNPANKVGMTNQLESKAVSVSGTSTCAGCEHGITPLGSPEELGLAVNTTDGRVIVVEDAHKLYPAAYASRFKGQQLRVRGQVIKTDGKVSWLQPSSLDVLN